MRCLKHVGLFFLWVSFWFEPSLVEGGDRPSDGASISEKDQKGEKLEIRDLTEGAKTEFCLIDQNQRIFLSDSISYSYPVKIHDDLGKQEEALSKHVADLCEIYQRISSKEKGTENQSKKSEPKELGLETRNFAFLGLSYFFTDQPLNIGSRESASSVGLGKNASELESVGFLRKKSVGQFVFSSKEEDGKIFAFESAEGGKEAVDQVLLAARKKRLGDDKRLENKLASCFITSFILESDCIHHLLECLSYRLKHFVSYCRSDGDKGSKDYQLLCQLNSHQNGTNLSSCIQAVQSCRSYWMNQVAHLSCKISCLPFQLQAIQSSVNAPLLLKALEGLCQAMNRIFASRDMTALVGNIEAYKELNQEREKNSDPLSKKGNSIKDGIKKIYQNLHEGYQGAFQTLDEKGSILKEELDAFEHFCYFFKILIQEELLNCRKMNTDLNQSEKNGESPQKKKDKELYSLKLLLSQFAPKNDKKLTHSDFDDLKESFNVSLKRFLSCFDECLFDLLSVSINHKYFFDQTYFSREKSFTQMEAYKPYFKRSKGAKNFPKNHEEVKRSVEDSLLKIRQHVQSDALEGQALSSFAKTFDEEYQRALTSNGCYRYRDSEQKIIYFLLSEEGMGLLRATLNGILDKKSQSSLFLVFHVHSKLVFCHRCRQSLCAFTFLLKHKIQEAWKDNVGVLVTASYRESKDPKDCGSANGKNKQNLAQNKCKSNEKSKQDLGQDSDSDSDQDEYKLRRYVQVSNKEDFKKFHYGNSQGHCLIPLKEVGDEGPSPQDSDADNGSDEESKEQEEDS